ncbi:MAG: (Fe-S)-binding protein [Calditrichaeota bacterium]|nr:(Fe-S)-binding protein [Calditrichota bacterium]
MNIHLFVPCLVDQAAPLTAVAARRILEKLGHKAIYDRRQTCCGQPLFNAGFRHEARSLAERFVRLFADAEVVVAPSGSCVAMVVKHYVELDLAPAIAKEWEALRYRIFELCSFLVNRLGITDLGAYFPHRVTYHASCHYLRGLGERGAPRQLLEKVEGLELIEGDWGEECCGFGGVFSVKYPALSRHIADRRAASLAAGGAEYITGVDDSCLGHLTQAFRRLQKPQQTLHIARILANAVLQ